MIGAEIAELWPFAAVAGAVLLIFLFVRGLLRRIEKGATSKDDLAELEQMGKDRDDAVKRRQREGSRLRDRFAERRRGMRRD
jgi:flagellar biosynthesis/type III secretory pathway M-ring protein FliF/YscJ